MYKRIALVLIISGFVLLCGNEFTKPTRTTRKEKVQQETMCDECIKVIDTLMERSCIIQQRLGAFAVRLYKTLRSCATDGEPAILQKNVTELKELLRSLKLLEKQLQEIENTMQNDKSFAILAS